MKAGEAKWQDALVFRVAEMFMSEPGRRPSTKEIAATISREFNVNHLTRETVYPLLGEAVKRGFLRLVPPVNHDLEKQLKHKYPLLESCDVRVVETAGPADNGKVAAVAAELAMGYCERILQHGGKRPIGLGLGPGRATRDFCREFRDRLAARPDLMQVSLMAISAGCAAEVPEYASSSFFNLFPEQQVARRIGLFAETLVPLKAFDQIKQRPGVREAFAARNEIDVVITSMGDFTDEHDLLRVFLESAGKWPSRRTGQWVGNVQYRPYSASGPIKERPDDLRAVTLFELEDLVRIAEQKFKEVILIARQCGLCGRSRAGALKPLLQHSCLKVFSTLVLDQATAADLLKG